MSLSQNGTRTCTMVGFLLPSKPKGVLFTSPLWGHFKAIFRRASKGLAGKGSQSPRGSL